METQTGRRAPRIELPERYNLVDHFVDRHLREGRGEKTAIVSDSRSLTYAETAQLVNRAANGLRQLGVEEEQRVLILLPDGPEFVAAYFGAIKIGAVAVPTSTALRARDYAYFLDESRSRALIVHSSLYPLVEPILGGRRALRHVIVCGERQPDKLWWDEWIERQSPEFEAAETHKDDVALWLWTSGSTGPAKAAVHLQSDWIYCCEYYARGVLGIGPEDITLSSSKLFHAYGLGQGLMFPFHVGATTVLHSSKSQAKAILQKAHDTRPTLFSSVPTLYAAMLQEADGPQSYDLSSVRLAVSAAEPLPAEIFRRWKERFGVEILDGIGSTEMLNTYLSALPGKVRPGSTGQPVPGYKLRIVDFNGQDVAPGVIGDLLVSGESAAACYWHRRRLSAERMQGEWFHPGDKYSVDEDGYYWYAGRSDDMFRVSGQWVSPIEVESALTEHPAVLEAAVVPFEANGLYSTKAFVVLKRGFAGSPDLVLELQAFVKQRITPYKYPRRVEFLSELPKSAPGKLLRYKLRESGGETGIPPGKTSPALNLNWQFTFDDLYRREGLVRLDTEFLTYLKSADIALFNRLMEARAAIPSRKVHSDLMMDLAPHLEDFIGELFGISAEIRALEARHNALDPLYAVKRTFVQKKAISGVSPEQASAIDGPALAAELESLFHGPLTEKIFVEHVSRWLENEAEHAPQLSKARQYAAWAALSRAGQAKHHHDILFHVPHKLDPQHLVPVETTEIDGIARMAFPCEKLRRREGFKLTDAGMDLAAALDQAHYCIKCHNQDKDSCSTGMKGKTGGFKTNAFGVTLTGCPLDVNISEMNVVKQRGHSIGALAIVTTANPLCAGTGHRICNDCVKACVFQKQDPVDIPQIETRTLKDVLELPWGFEIYSLLTRWNPLDFARPVPKPDSGYKVLVVGLGPAGFTLSHRLMNDGHTVVAIDGLKIEPVDENVSGRTVLGKGTPFRPIHDVNELYEPLDDRVMAGFGGVAEYGITVRWNKNFLKVIRLLLERRAQFSMFGGVRFGGTISVDSAFDMGFDHVALCAGAGRPTVIPMKNGLARGVRQASDFLMALQLTGAAKRNCVANLQLRMPVVVIGGGLTAIDTATESLAYYVVQVEKFLERYEKLAAEGNDLRTHWNAEESATADEFLAHARAIQAERAAAAAGGREPNLVKLLNSWGGVTIAYRRRLLDSPGYTLNHEEVAKALEEGVHFAECLTPEAVEVDPYGHAQALLVKNAGGEPLRIPAKAILVAAGTQPNTVLAREDPHNVFLDGKWFQAVDEDGHPVKPERVAKPAASHVLMSLRADGRAISFFGDLHPSYAGNVVKAMASAKQGYPVVSRTLARRAPSALNLDTLNEQLRAVVHDVIRLTPNIVEVVVKAPMAARAFQPGQFYRLQNYETLASHSNGTTLAMEGLALTGASVDREKGLLSTIVLEMGGSSDLCALLKPGEPVILMGPTGTPTETPSGETVLLIGGGLGNAVLFSIGQQLRANGSRTIYFAGYKKIIDRYKVEQIEKAADVVVWCCDEAPGFTPGRQQDKTFCGNIVEALAAYGRGDLRDPENADPEIPLSSVDRLVVIGSDAMMHAVARARHGVLASLLKPDHKAIGSINSPMQCMMKEICAQCLQVHKDPVAGEETVVFSCFNQDQSLDHVDFSNLRTRLAQNSVQEKLTKQWIGRCLL